MKTIIEDFDYIASRLTEIEQEKHTEIMTAPVENSAEQIASMYGIQYVLGTDSGDTAPCEYVGYTDRCADAERDPFVDHEAVAVTLRELLGFSAIKT